MQKSHEIYLKIGRRLFDWDEMLHIKQLENGYVFGHKYYADMDNLIMALKKALEEEFK